MSLKDNYEIHKSRIQSRLRDFSSLPEEEYFKEFLFCLLTPQSNAKKCWQAVEELSKIKPLTKKSILTILKSKTRFHNNKSRYVLEAYDTFNSIKPILNTPDKAVLRNLIAENVKGYGLKEASHFLRNIGKSGNQIAILDRHILRNLKSLGVLENDKIQSKKEYLTAEQKFIQFSKKVGIPIDELDLLFWSKETGEVFK